MLHGTVLKSGFAVLFCAGLAAAHLMDGSLSVKGGETFAPNQVVPLKWNVTVLHDGKMDIDFSKNGGTSWTSIRAGYQATSGDNTFNWTVPNESTIQGKVRVCLGAGSSCTDVKVSSPSSAAYALVSPVFTISGTSAISPAAAKGAFSLDYSPATRNVAVSFALAESGPVLLQAFDTRGRLLATLLQGDFAAGSHTLSLFSDRLETAGALIFKLKAGSQVQSQNWVPAR
jgi:hypothetical protein